ncbi:glycoside hydrolase family 31 protein [Pontibacillus marinus]|uniref:Alpha-glucosidase n=1 Tax=Pontibacillus marinus BH030004 = DSM 16465 TaxID=1385511 RepID=A0A0A5FYP1_9BACI|nr:glycoside hydrolase family 31 protein [Pontibacillus marinus]KGX83943.1 alpha-glucosidase [Pontibacillus marinus BH030004 = DSM 16465]
MLEDTSFAIHPGNNQNLSETSYQDVGNVTHVDKDEKGYTFYCENGYVTVTFNRADIIRIVMNQKAIPSLKSTPAVIAQPETVEQELKEESDSYIISTSKLDAYIQKAPFRLRIQDKEGHIIASEQEKGLGFQENGEVICYKEMLEQDRFYGFGEKTGFLDKRGESYTMWNSDVFAPHNPETDPLYQSIPYFMSLRDGRAHGIFFDNSYKSTFDMKTESDHYSFRAEGGQLDYYVFIGPSPKDVIEQYTHVTGRMPLPPKWAIGYHQSRYSYKSEQEVREVANAFIEKNIPVDVLYLDIHYMNEYRVFTFDKDQFPTPENMIQDLKNAGIRVVPIVDPGVKKAPEYSIYQEGVREDHFCKYLEGDIYTGDVWPGESAFPDFTDERTRKWWGEKHQYYADLGIEGIWNDMNEPAVFNETKTMDTNVMHKNDGDPQTHRALHNLYGLLMGEATYKGMKEQLGGKRSFLLTRAGYSGVQRYASVWTGDNRSFWEHLQMALPMCMNLGLSGVAFSGPDVGGFAHDTNGELLTRWTQVGAFTPYFRNHSALDTVRQEPWQFGEKYEAIIRDYIQLRYQWLPQLYSLFREAHETGVPVMRPLMLEYPHDEKTYQLYDEFMIGDNTLIAPIMHPEVTDRAVYFPEGTWVDYFTGEEYSGKQTHLIHAELDKLPMFIKKGSFVALSPVRQSTMHKQDSLIFHVYANDEGEYKTVFYDDDGETYQYEGDDSMKLPVTISSTPDEVSITFGEKQGGFNPSYQNVDVYVHGLQDNQTITLNGEKVSGERSDQGVHFQAKL